MMRKGEKKMQDQKPKLNNKVVITDDQAEMRLYGDVVSERPTDWWTGEPLPGDYICLSEFAEDLESIGDVSKVTFKICSLGGDLFAGLAIGAKIKDLKAETTVIVEGIIASAATAIALCADHTKVHPSDQVMIHDPSAFLCGYYNISDVEKTKNMLETGIKSLTEIYTSKSSMTWDEVEADVKATTWMTGREAVEKGYIDELIEDNPAYIALTDDGKAIVVNGSYQMIRKRPIPAGISSLKSRVTNTISHTKLNGGDRKLTTADELRSEYPNLVDSIEKEAYNRGMEAGISQENARLADIERIQATVCDDALIADAKFGEKKISAQELLFNAAAKAALMLNTHIQARTDELTASGVGEVGTAMAPDEMNIKPEAEIDKEASELANYFTSRR